jgi:DNA-directed RNA polymerase subunit RPC12/RpoP
MDNIVLVTVATFPEAIEAHIFRSRLESEGIRCVIADEPTVSNQPWLTMASGGIKLQVQQQDRERAAGIIARIRGINAPAICRCPVCASDKIAVKRNGNVVKRVLALLFGTPGQQIYTCLTCGLDWRIA